MARCPAHDDRINSLSIKRESDKWLVHCHRGCDIEKVLQAADPSLTTADLFFGERKSSKGQPQGKEECAYDYVDENGMLLFQIVRLKEPKGFYARRSNGKGGWINSLKGVRRVLYRLPEVLQAEDVLVVAGEKDVHTAERLGLIATSNPLGEGKWKPEYSESLRGKKVTIIPDKDATGIRHGRTVARSLLSVVASVKAAEALRALMDDAPPLTDADVTAWSEPEPEKPEPKQKWPFKALTIAQFLAKGIRPLKPLIGDILHAQEIVAMIARRRNGKTTLLTDMLMTAADGEPDWLGFAIPEPLTTLYVYLDDPPGLVDQNVRKRAQSLECCRFLLLTQDDFKETAWAVRQKPTDFMVRLRDSVEEFRPQILVLDNASMVLEGAFNDSERVMALMTYVNHLGADFDCAIIIPAHPRKLSQAKGAVKFKLAQDAEGFFEEVLGSSVFINHPPNLWGVKRDSQTGLTTARLGAQRTTGEDSLMTLSFNEDTRRFSVTIGPENLSMLNKTDKRKSAWDLLPYSFSFSQGEELVSTVMARMTYANYLREAKRMGLLAQDLSGIYTKKV
jgi:hypothetical protein